ncbi:MAG: hypothetical protein SH809_18375 [Rhodothermales bacterium]|nr:hypothetical protein [Rhodothermales bacterium]
MPRQPITLLYSLFCIVGLFYLTGCHTSILAPDPTEDTGITQDQLGDGSGGGDTGGDDNGGDTGGDDNGGTTGGDDNGDTTGGDDNGGTTGGGDNGENTGGGDNGENTGGDDDGGDDAGQAPVSLEAPLRASDGSDASGEAKFERRSDRVTFTVEVEDMEDDGTATIVVVRAGAVVYQGSLRIDAGSGNLNMDSRDGDTVPSLTSGDRVRVEDPAGAVALSGLL